MAGNQDDFSICDAWTSFVLGMLAMRRCLCLNNYNLVFEYRQNAVNAAPCRIMLGRRTTSERRTPQVSLTWPSSDLPR